MGNSEELTPNPGIPDELRTELNASSDETPVEEQEPSEEAKQEEGTADGELTPEKDEVDYKEKFIHSSQEALRLLKEKEAQQEKIKELEGYKSALEEIQEKELRELEQVDPQAAKTLRMERELQAIKNSTLIERRERELNEFVASNPQSAPDREALKTLMSANPSKSLSELDNLFLRPIRERVATESIEKLHKQKSAQVEKGKGSKTQEPTSSNLPDDFDKWPIDKRKAYFKKVGL